MCSYREHCICEDLPFLTTADCCDGQLPQTAGDLRPLQTQLQLVGLENYMALKVDDVAPDFELPAIAGDRQITMRSRDYLGRQNLVVAFHPLDWTPT
jgi:hypothetical protein